MVGDFPPSSSVTLVRCLAAAAMTTLPTAGEPVKKIWSKGRASSALEVGKLPSNRATSSLVKISAMMRAIRADTAGIISDGLMITVLPAARADTSGPKHRLSG